jgi:very-short-patch-repair endonuclease
VTPPDTRIAEIATRQHGLVRTSDLRAIGVSAAAASRRRARGLLHRIYRGVDAVGHTALSREGRWLAPVFAAGEGAALSHLAAAEAWRIGRAKGATDVTAPRRVRIGGVRVHHAKHLDPRDVTVRNDIPVTTVARTIVDLAEIRTVEQLTNHMYEADFWGLLDLDAVQECAERLLGRHGLATLEEAIGEYLRGSAGSKSEKEDAFHAIVRDRLQKPIANVKVLGHEVDAYWPEHKLIAEVDGPGHGRPRARRRDRKRDRELKAAGYRVLRFTDVDVELRPDLVLRRLYSAMNGMPT